MIILNRSLEKINKNTPVFIIIEYIKTIGIDIEGKDIDENILKKTKEFSKSIELKQKYSVKELQEIIIFVNGDEINWKVKNLLIAFNHIINTKYDDVDWTEITFCQKNNDNPYAYDYIMTYEACLKNRIEYNINDTYESLQKKLIMKTSQKKIILYKTLNIIQNLDFNNLVDLYISNKNKNKNTDFIFNKESLGDNTLDKNDLIEYSVLSDNKSIIIGARYYGIDLTESTKPYRELKQMALCEKNKKNYVPIMDDIFKKRYLINKDYYSLEKNWKKNLSKFYTSKQFTSLVQYECIEEDTLIEQKEKLHSINENIDKGIHPLFTGNETFIYRKTIDELNKDEIFSYCLKDKIIILTIEEIIEFFRSKNSFINFFCDKEFEYRIIKKLLNFCDYNPNIEKLQILRSIILQIKKKTEIVDININNLKKEYSNNKNQIDTFLNHIFELSMYMRGWKVFVQDYPLKKEICDMNISKKDVIDININNKIKELFSFINESNIKDIFIKLPLIKINDKDKSVYKSNIQDEGLTLYERLRILIDKKENIYSCIRMSSNHIFSSYYYYCKDILKHDAKADIEDLDFIS